MDELPKQFFALDCLTFNCYIAESKTALESKIMRNRSKRRMPKTKAGERDYPTTKGPISTKALNSFANRLAETFIGDNDIVNAVPTVSGCELLLTNGKTIVIDIRPKAESDQ